MTRDEFLADVQIWLRDNDPNEEPWSSYSDVDLAHAVIDETFQSLDDADLLRLAASVQPAVVRLDGSELLPGDSIRDVIEGWLGLAMFRDAAALVQAWE